MAYLPIDNERNTPYLKDVHDIKIIPDKHNTGVDENVVWNVAHLSDPQSNITINGLVITCRPSDFIINPYGNTNAPSEVIIDNWDFSAGFFLVRPILLYLER